ncbi:hypothetical protein BT96DRAFT_1006955 [Gymnopus androsaceus JB14]|uniref:Uncharacterized protein n=1 Tax=Gymnopus androsaceus JB14 TaxID=1447944 RepID=A0A6A4GIN0_9AGAR|nr:hypothetical protein BT96DRAFT_1006955 [Gymnopus androsaceus JB14]
MEAYFEAQREHITHAKALRDQINLEPGTSALWNVPLLLPSEIHMRGSTCSKALLVCEWWLQHAACHDALELMRKNLLICTGLISYKIKYLHGQYDGTQSSQTVNAISAKIRACASQYRASFAVVEKYAKKLDVTLSWIWMAAGVDSGNDGKAMHDSLRIAWCKASARAHRWQEECLLLQEEMRQVPVTLEAQAQEWENHRANEYLSDMSTEMIEGRIAYANRQASLRRTLASYCSSKWANVLVELGSGLGDIRLSESEYVLA